MAMSQEQFEALVRRLEEYTRRQPGSYRLRVVLLAALGYAYLLLVLALLCTLIALLVAAAVSGHAGYLIVKLGWLLVTLIAIMVRALWVRLEAPDGIEIHHSDAPPLFQVLNELGAALRAPRFHHVLLTGDFNAGVVQVPRLGIFGWQQNYLLLGLPLMQALSQTQFRAVLAHELGHLSGNHSRFAGWIYRVRQTWGQLLERLEQQRHPGIWIFHPFLKWYAPFFSAYTFVLARADEYVADRCAAEQAGATASAEALIHLAIKGEYLGREFWPRLYKAADQQPEPPVATFVALAGALQRGITAPAAARWLDQKLTEKTDYDDTHPSLSERLTALAYLPKDGDTGALNARLTALGYRPASEGDPPPGDAPPSPPETMAAELLGPATERLSALLEQNWRQVVAPQWQERYRYSQETQAKLAALEEKAAVEPLTEEEALNRARWTAEFRDNAAAIPLFQEFLQAHPEHAVAQFALGEILLEAKDEEGLRHLEKAMAADSDAVIAACQRAYAFLKEQDRGEEAESYRRRAEEQYERLVRAQQERAGVSDRDRFEPHGLPSEAIEKLREQLSRIEKVGAVYLARKVVTLFPEKPLYVLAVAPHSPWYRLRSEGDEAKLSARLAQELEFPGETNLVVLNQHKARLKRALRKVPGAEIYRKA